METCVDKREWFKAIDGCDIGLTLGSNSIFGKLQNFYRKRISKAKHRASHGFFLKNNTKISEADGKYVKESNLQRYLNSNRQVWIFRYVKISQEQKDKMQVHANAAEVSGGTYSWLGMFQFASKFISPKKRIKDKPGVFCSEHTSRIINAGGLRYSSLGKVEPWKITPSMQLSWFFEQGKAHGWKMVARFDGNDYWTCS